MRASPSVEDAPNVGRLTDGATDASDQPGSAADPTTVAGPAATAAEPPSRQPDELATRRGHALRTGSPTGTDTAGQNDTTIARRESAVSSCESQRLVSESVLTSVRQYERSVRNRLLRACRRRGGSSAPRWFRLRVGPTGFAHDTECFPSTTGWRRYSNSGRSSGASNSASQSTYSSLSTSQTVWPSSVSPALMPDTCPQESNSMWSSRSFQSSGSPGAW